MEETKQRVFILGDNHGRYNVLFEELKKFEINNCIIIHVGDGGEGFLYKRQQLQEFEDLNSMFKELNIQYMSIRGNHSDPQYFKGNISLSNFRLLPDYHTEIINGQKFLFVGGAISIDRGNRTAGLSYWKDEAFVLKPELITTCDVLITHSSPEWLGPNDKGGIAYWCRRDETLWAECVEERRLHSELYKLAKPTTSYCGHFHEHYAVKNSELGITARVLCELELLEHV